MTINLQRRQKVMARSHKLGHCVCEPSKNCPCESLITKNICPCAGEKAPVASGAVALTKTVRKAGCASKISQGDLIRILKDLPPVTDPKVLVGMAAGDDAGVYELNDTQALVQTVDVFTPCVDDPYLFGQIAAANSVSDVYAMGGTPLTALSVVGFPIEELDGCHMKEMLRGGIDKLSEAGCVLLGGHSINDGETKCGFAVTGLIDKACVVERAQARPGDVLVLTKPLGTGMVLFGVQIGRLSRQCLDEIGASMATLNRDAAELMGEFGAHACTDVTGFGLAGHLVEMVRGSGASAEIDFSTLPVFAAAGVCLEREILSGAIERNQEYSMAWVQSNGATDEAQMTLPILYDPQTSGGLLVALPPEAAQGYIDAMHERGHGATSAIGRIVEKSDPKGESEVVITNALLGNLVGNREGIIAEPESAAAPEPAAEQTAAPLTIKSEARQPPEPEMEAEEEACCDSPPVFDDEDTPATTMELFQAFSAAANRPGLIDARAKKLMAIALSIAHHCEPCLKIHLRGALKMGLSKAEIDEAADLAIAFGGCTAMMLYKQICQELKI